MAFVDLPGISRPIIRASVASPSGINQRLITRDDADLARGRGGRVQFVGVEKTFATPNGPLPALNGISFEVGSGEIFGVIGRSGAGKSTLIRLINGLESPNAGHVLVDDVDISSLDPAGLRRIRRRIGMIFQHFNLLSSRTVEENVALPLRLAGVSRRLAHARAADLLSLVGLSDRARTYPSQLSGGQKQRVGIARALVSDPSILLSDEATSALDPQTTQSILALLKDIQTRLGITIILITHEMEVIRAICDRVGVIERGQIAEIGPIWEVFGDPKSDAARALLRQTSQADGTDHLPLAAPNTPILEIEFTGAETSEPDLHAIFNLLGPGSRLLHGSIERIQGRSQGRLLIAVSSDWSRDAAAQMTRLKAVAPRSRLLG